MNGGHWVSCCTGDGKYHVRVPEVRAPAASVLDNMNQFPGFEKLLPKCISGLLPQKLLQIRGL